MNSSPESDIQQLHIARVVLYDRNQVLHDDLRLPQRPANFVILVIPAQKSDQVLNAL